MRHELHLCSFWVKHNTQHCENEPYGLSQSYWKLEQCSDFDWDLVFYLAFKKITLFNCWEKLKPQPQFEQTVKTFKKNSLWRSDLDFIYACSESRKYEQCERLNDFIHHRCAYFYKLSKKLHRCENNYFSTVSQNSPFHFNLSWFQTRAHTSHTTDDRQKK